MHHTTLGFCWWDLPAAIILIAMIVIFIIRHNKMKKQIKDLEDQLQGIYNPDVDGENLTQ